MIKKIPPEIKTCQLQGYDLAHSKQINLLVADNMFPPFTGFLWFSPTISPGTTVPKSARAATIVFKVGTTVPQSQYSQHVHTKLQGPLFLASQSGPCLIGVIPAHIPTAATQDCLTSTQSSLLLLLRLCLPLLLLLSRLGCLELSSCRLCRQSCLRFCL